MSSCQIGLLAMVMFIMLTLLIYFGITTVHPYVTTSGYEEALCQPINVTDHGLKSCDCSTEDDENCESTFPCKEMIVLVRPTHLDKYTSKIIQYYRWYDSECFLQPCTNDASHNADIVSRAIQEFGPGISSPYACWYNPENVTQVIAEKTSKIAVIMAMFWPSFVLLICVFVLIVWFLRATRKQYF